MTSLTNRSTFSLMDFGRNNLADASSPYLRQHGDNPVWWQEWSPEVLAHAKKEDKPLLVSVGYSTCHWCHVMAADAFSNEEIAEVLNRDFVTIKVDREQRPDIDQYLMSFLVATTGNGGWPLNAFLTPNGHPFFAMTYAASTPRFSMPAFSDILTQVSEFYSNRKEEIRAFEVPAVRTDTGGADGGVDFSQISKQIESVYDHEYAGFGSSQKFPPHATLLFLLYASATQADEPAGQALLRYATGTLDAMKDGGLHDHLQGGFYRYCVDRSWTIPHFEKMLYDQAMLLWTYSLASRVANSDDYREVSDGVFRSLEETFRMGDLYAAAHDADTDHHEGDTYVWSLEEIESILDGAELEAFREYFDVTQSGNFEGRNHIVKRRPDDSGNDITGVDAAALERATETLLAARKARVQPFRDEKLLSAWNSLAGCGLVAAHRFAGTAGAFERARQIAQRIAEDVSPSGVVPHDIAHPNEGGSFLADHAAYALLLLMLGEESNEFDTVLKTVMANLMSFREDGAWFESSNDDFRRMPADTFDSPSPSSSALADMAVLIDKVRSHQEYADLPVGNPLAHGFAGLAGLISQGHFHAVERPSPIPWSTLPVNTIQFQGEKTVDCYRGVCLMNLDHLIHDKKTDG